jgi:hypothetical protein
MKNLTRTFLSLTSRTYPYGMEKRLINKFITEYQFQKDEYGNIYKIINAKNEYNGTEKLPSTLFTAHLDTVSTGFIYRLSRRFKLPILKSRSVEHILTKDEDFVKTDGYSILGADDKAGVVIMLEMIKEEKPGIYYFFIGEEYGRIGSRKVRDYFYESIFLKNIKKCISFDRSGYTSIITHQRYFRTCSDEFATTICNLLNENGFWFFPDPTGKGTDCLSFADKIDECTNISVGYFKEHTTRECQDLEFLNDLTQAILKIDWEGIITTRNISKKNANYGFNDFSYKKIKNLIKPYYIPPTKKKNKYPYDIPSLKTVNVEKSNINGLETVPVKDDNNQEYVDKIVENIIEDNGQ